MDQELEGFGDVSVAETAVPDTLGIVGNCGDGATGAATIAGVIHIAVGGGTILGVNEMERCGPFACGGGAVGVCPGGNACEV